MRKPAKCLGASPCPSLALVGDFHLAERKTESQTVISLLAVRSEPEARNPASQLTSREGKPKSLASPGARLGDRGRWGCHKSPEMSVLVHPHTYGLYKSQSSPDSDWRK